MSARGADEREGEEAASLSMEWAEITIVFWVSHLAGDFLLQTDWQAEHKHGGLGRDSRVPYRALLPRRGLHAVLRPGADLDRRTDTGASRRSDWGR